MALAALIFAALAIDEHADVPRATLPLAGGTVLERQVRLAAAAGAAPIVLLVEQLPIALTTAIDRLRHDGVRLEVACTIADAVDRIHPDEALLVMADGHLAGTDAVDAVAQAASPALLVVPDDAEHARCERIDATARWGGLLLIDGTRLRRTAAMLGEWDLQSTLLRLAVQEGAQRLDAYLDGDAPVVVANDGGTLARAELAMVRSGLRPPRDWPERFVFPPIVGRSMMPLLRRRVDSAVPRLLEGGLALLSLPLLLFGMSGAALGLLMLSGVATAIGRRLADIRLEPGGPAWPGHVRLGGAALASVLLGAGLAETSGWGCWLVGLSLPVMMAALDRQRRIARHVGAPAEPIWLATMDALIWAMPAVAILVGWLAALAALAVYAAGSFAFVQHRTVRALAIDGDAAD